MRPVATPNYRQPWLPRKVEGSYGRRWVFYFSLTCQCDSFVERHFQVRNPLYKGEWAPRMQANPAYRQYEWVTSDKGTILKVPNIYFTPRGPLMEPSTALAIEVMNVNPGMSFDNFFISQRCVWYATSYCAVHYHFLLKVELCSIKEPKTVC